MTAGHTDSEILAAIQADAERGFTMLLDRYQQPVYWHIRRITVLHGDAEDAMQETFMRVFRHMGRFQSDKSLGAWIYRIATNEAIRQRKRHKGLTLSLDDATVTDAGGAIADEYVDFSDLESVKLQKAILALPPKQQAVFNLRYYDGFDYALIAEITGSTPANAKASYHVAKRKVIDYMLKHD